MPVLTETKNKLTVNGIKVRTFISKQGSFTRRQIQDVVNKVSKDARADGSHGTIQVGLFYKPGRGKNHIWNGWRSGKHTVIGKDPRLPTIVEYEGSFKDPTRYQKFFVSIVPMNKQEQQRWESRETDISRKQEE